MKIEKVILGCACVVMVAPYLRATPQAAKHPTLLVPHMLLACPRDYYPTSSDLISLSRPLPMEVMGP
jgi:hypothetical protein